MNAPHAITGPHAVKFTVDDFLLLKKSGAFDGFSKSELINGHMTGVPHRDADGNDWTSDASIPIKLRSRDYERLAEAGAFEGVGKTELVDGTVYTMSPQYRAHGYATSELDYRLRRALEALASPLYVAFEQSVDLAEHSEPQPDIILTTAPRGEGAIPAASVALLVEVSVSTRAFDLGDKAAVYGGGRSRILGRGRAGGYDSPTLVAGCGRLRKSAGGGVRRAGRGGHDRGFGRGNEWVELGIVSPEPSGCEGSEREMSRPLFGSAGVLRKGYERAPDDDVAGAGQADRGRLLAPRPLWSL